MINNSDVQPFFKIKAQNTPSNVNNTSKNNLNMLDNLFTLIFFKKILGFSPLYKNFFKVLPENFYTSYTNPSLNSIGGLDNYNSISLGYNNSYKNDNHLNNSNFIQYIPKISSMYIKDYLSANDNYKLPKFKSKSTNYNTLSQPHSNIFYPMVKHKFFYKVLYKYLHRVIINTQLKTNTTLKTVIKNSHTVIPHLNKKLIKFFIKNKLNLLNYLQKLNIDNHNSATKLNSYLINKNYNLKTIYTKIMHSNKNSHHFFLKKSFY